MHCAELGIEPGLPQRQYHQMQQELPRVTFFFFLAYLEFYFILIFYYSNEFITSVVVRVTIL